MSGSTNGHSGSALVDQVTPKITDSLSEKRLEAVLRHIENVRDNCLLLGQRLIEQGNEEFGRTLIANGLIHDNSKLHGIEWLYLHEDVKETNEIVFKLAFQHHITTNAHHPEFWQSIDHMPEIYLAEMVCDCKSRSEEFGTDVHDWFVKKACKKYGISPQGKTYKHIKEFLDLLIDRRFT
jgi:hypothetical protein